MPIESAATMLVKTPQNPAGISRSVYRWHGSITRTVLINAALAGTGVSRLNGMITLGGNIYCDEDCSIDFTNTTINLKKHVIYIHPDADIHWQDVLFYSADRRDGPNVTIFPEWGRWNADGGGILGTQRGANSKDRMHCFVGLISNVQIRQDMQSQNDILFFPFLGSGTYRNIKALKIEGINMNGNDNVADLPIIMHDCEFRASNSTGTRVAPLNNGSMILNDCIFGRMDGGIPTGGNNWMWDNVAPHVTRVPHHIYFCGATKTRWSETWGRSADDTHLQSHQAGLRYYQVYKEGQILGGARARLYSELDTGDGSPTTAHRKSQVTLGNNEMLELPNAAMGTDGRFNVMTIKKTRLNESNSWNTHTQRNHILRVRERGIIFQDIQIQDATVSVGRPDNPVPFVVQPDPNFDANIAGITLAEIDDRISLNFSTKVITMQDNTSISVKQLYSYLKVLHAEYIYFHHHMDMHFDGTTLWLEDWSLAIGDNCSLTLGGGTRIVSLLGTITHGVTFHNAGVELIDVNGVSVFVGSPAPGARAIIKYGTNDPIYADVENNPDDNSKNPWSSLIPLNTDVTVVVKAPGYSYERYAFNTGTQTMLDARLPREPTIDLGVSFTNAERDAMSFRNFTIRNNNNSKDLEDGCLEITLNEIQLRDQLKKSRRIFDWHMSQNNGLLFLLNYESQISGDPLNGRAFVYETDRTRMDVSNTDSEAIIRWKKISRSEKVARWGDPIYLPTGSDESSIYSAPITRRENKVIFDNVILQGRVGEAVIADSAQRLAENPAYTNALAKAAWDYLHTNTLVDNSFGKLVKTNLDARVSQVEGGSGGGTTNMQQSNLGYFRIANRMIAGGGISNRLIEAQGTGVHPHQLFVVSRIPRNNNAELQIYDISGGDDGEQFYGQTHIPWLTADTPIDAACIDEDYLYLAIQNPANSTNSIHRIPIDTSPDATTTYVSVDVGFRVRGLCINGNSLVMARVTSSTIRLFTLPLPLTADATGPQVINHPDTDHAGEYMGMALVGSGTDQVIAVCSGTRRILTFSPDDYSHIDNYDLDFDAMGMIWWQARPWTVRRRDADNFYLQPLELDYTAIRQEYLANLIRSNPQRTWEISDDDAHHENNTVGAALLDMLTNFALLNVPGGGLESSKLNKLSNLDALVSSRLAATDYTAPATPANLTAAKDAIITKVETNKTAIDGVKGVVDGIPTTAAPTTGAIKTALEAAGSNLAAIKTKTDKLNFNTADDVKATLDNETVTPATAPPTAAQIKTELESSGSNLAVIKAQTDKINFSGTGTPADPYLVDAHASGITAEDLTVDLTDTNAKIDGVKTVVDAHTTTLAAIPTTSYTATLNNIIAKIDDVKTGVDAIPTAAQHTLQQISDAVRSLADYDDDEGTTTSLKAILDEILSDLLTIEQQLLLDTVDSNDTALKRLKDSKTILDKFRFTSNDVKATLDGEKVVTDDASRTASKATGFATPANVTDARDNVKTAITAAHTTTDGKVDDVKTVVDGLPTTEPATPTNITTAETNIKTAITTAKDSIETEVNANETKLDTAIMNIGTVDTVVDAIQTELTADAIDDGTGTSTNRETVKKVIDDIETKVDTTISQTTATAISDAVETAFLDDDDGRQFLQQILDKVEQAIEEESLTENALASAIRREVWQHIINPDDAEADQVNAQTALNDARVQIDDVVETQLPAATALLNTLITAANWLVSIGRADIRQTADLVTYYERGTETEIIKFKRRPQTQTSDWSGGWEDPALTTTESDD